MTSQKEEREGGSEMGTGLGIEGSTWILVQGSPSS